MLSPFQGFLQPSTPVSQSERKRQIAVFVEGHFLGLGDDF